MTELEYIEIEGFKGLEHVEFEPTDINLITGRNNTGKTSFLEAIDLSSNPRKIQIFNENAGSVIRNGFSEGLIETTTSSNRDRLVIRPASGDEIKKYFREAIRQHLQSSIRTGNELKRDNDDVPLRGYSLSTETKAEEVTEKFREVVSNVTTRVVERELFDSFGTTSLVLEFGKKSYPYLYFGQAGWDLASVISEELENSIDNEFESEEWEKHPDGYVIRHPDIKDRVIEFEIGYSSVLRGGFFVREPSDRELITFISSADLISKTQDIDHEDNAIRVDDIGDFVKEKSLVNRLKTFNLETLIFESEHGEKYPVPYDFMGDGFKSMVGLLWELMDDDIENNIVLIEEPETHMHPGYVAELVHFLIDLARDEDIQFFITTHDHDFIKDFFTDMPEEKRKYLEDEFSLVKMDDFGADVMEYGEAEHHLKDLHLDLRGI